MTDQQTTTKLSFIEKAGYSLGDGAANFVFMTMILFQLNFYTDTFGIVAGIAGTLLLVGRLWDARSPDRIQQILKREGKRNCLEIQPIHNCSTFPLPLLCFGISSIGYRTDRLGIQSRRHEGSCVVQ